MKKKLLIYKVYLLKNNKKQFQIFLIFLYLIKYYTFLYIFLLLGVFPWFNLKLYRTNFGETLFSINLCLEFLSTIFGFGLFDKVLFCFPLPSSCLVLQIISPNLSCHVKVKATTTTKHRKPFFQDIFHQVYKKFMNITFKY